MAGTIVVDRIESDGSYASTINVASKVNFTGGMQIGGQDTTFAGMRNRIINGAMLVDQRNAGGSVSTHLSYPVDRFPVVKDTSAGTFTMAQSSSVPAGYGFTKSVVFTVGTAYTPIAGENNFFKHMIEGYNIADCEFGTVNAKPVTLSFWVRSSLTGTFGGSLRNGTSDRSYVFSYSINQANTWEYKTITIPGDTTGTWRTLNELGFEISWSLSCGSTNSNTAGSWYNGNYINSTGSVNVTSTAGATWYITGVQLEKGSVATPFEHRFFASELKLCERYYQKSYAYATKPGTNTLAGWENNVSYLTNGQGFSFPIRFKTIMRTTPSMTFYDLAGTAGKIFVNANGATPDAQTGYYADSGVYYGGTASSTGQNQVAAHWTANAEL